MDNPSLVTVLTLLATGIGVGGVVSFLLEQTGAFQRLSPDAKRWTTFALCIAIPALAQIAIQFVPPDVWPVLEPYWQAVAAGFLIWAGSQMTHRTFHRPQG